METLLKLLDNAVIVNGVMAVIVFGLTFIVKLPIKILNKTIVKKLPDKCFSATFTRDKLRRILNLFVLLIPFGLGILTTYLWDTFYLKSAFDIISGLGVGTASISLYGVINQFLSKQGLGQIQNDYNTADGHIIVNTVQQITKDGKLTKTDTEAIKQALKDFKNV